MMNGTFCLSPETRALARRYLSGEFGRELKPASFQAPSVPSPFRHRAYANTVMAIALEAPLRLLPEERLAGAATLCEAMEHRTPASEFPSSSHTTIDFEKALRLGLNGIRAEVENRLARGGLDEQGVEFLEAMRTCLDAYSAWKWRYLRELERLARAAAGPTRAALEKISSLLKRAPEEPPETFPEALQALWILWDFQRLCGNWSGIGRIDKMLGPFLDRDLANGSITRDEAREYLAHFWIKGCEWITSRDRGSGDAQFYQNIVLAGVDEDGAPVLNEVTRLVLDVVEELRISDFPIAVRLSSGTPSEFLRRVAEVQRLGGGIIAVYNDDRIIPMLAGFGYPLREARNYANDGCWELLIPGKTDFGYQPFDALRLLQETLGLNGTPGEPPAFADFECLYSAFRTRLETAVTDLIHANPFRDSTEPLLSLLVEGCIEKARTYHNGGPVYTVRSPHAGGLPDVANSLLAIRTFVFEEKKLSLGELVQTLKDDWSGREELRQTIRRRLIRYGNDHDASDAMLRRVFNDFTEIAGRTREYGGVLRPAGISTFGREGAAFLQGRTATADGHKKGDILAPNLSPTPGTDSRGPTAVIRSHCSVDLGRLPCGTALDLKILPQSVDGQAGLDSLSSLMRGFVAHGGIFMQIDVVDNSLLLEAQAHPDRYPDLAVRVSGWSARFQTLSKPWQDMIIARTQQPQDPAR